MAAAVRDGGRDDDGRLPIARSGVEETWANGSAIQTAFEVVQQVNTWVWVLALLGLGHHFLGRENRVLRYANPAAYLFYLVHQTVIIAVAYVVVRWNAGPWMKFGLVLMTSFGLSLAAYELSAGRTPRGSCSA